jgi:molybdopterin-guanine dinucleotide biosynthesis protein B
MRADERALTQMQVFGIAGWSGSGKTRLMKGLIPALTKHGLTVSTLKHAHHSFDIDVPGKDSYEHRAAGACEVMISSANRWALMHELKGMPEPRLDDLIARMTPVDLLLVEGFKWEAHPKLEVHRPSVGKPLLQPDDPHIVAVASDEPLEGLGVPLLDINDAVGIADFIVARCRLLAA